MGQLLNTVLSYLQYYAEAGTIYQAHSPALYDFAAQVVEGSVLDEAIFQDIENSRITLLADRSTVDFVELGAGSRSGSQSSKTIRSIAQSSLSGRRQCRQLAKMVLAYRPSTVVELGTSLGIATMYLAAADGSTQVHTLEGDPTVAARAQSLFKQHQLSNIHLHQGPFEQTLEPLLAELSSVDMAFVDGNHSYQPTMDYFHLLLRYAAEQCVLVFDDIYWSTEMQQAWSDIKAHPQVAHSIDLYHMGVVLVGSNDRQPAHHHKLIEYKYKPWRIGVFG